MLNKLVKFFLICLLISITGNLAAQSIPISGTITDNNGEPLVGVSIAIKGTSQGTISDLEGMYSISVPNSKSELVFSYIGYSIQTIIVGNQKVINVRLKEDAFLLDEAVVIGYGSTRKQDLSMAVSTVKLDQAMKSRPGAGVGTLLQGRVSGMTIQADGGDPLKGQTFTIRGKGSRDDDGVLWVVDGVPGAPYSVEDIETITVMKDAASAAIYGAQVGAGGVILITTKKAQAGKVKVEANVSYGVKSAWKLPKAVTAEQYMQLWSDVIAASTTGQLGMAQDKNAYPYGNVTRTDWVDEVFRTAQVQHYALSLSGGSETIKTLASVQYNKNEGIMLNTWAENLNAKVHTDFQITKWLKLSERATFGYSNGQGEVDNNGHQGVLTQAIFYPRSATVYEYNPDGTVVLGADGVPRYGGTFPVANPQGVSVGYGELRNPVASLERLRQNRPSATVFSTTSLEIKPISSLTLKSDFSARLNPARREDFSPLAYELGVSGNPENYRSVENWWNRSYVWESTASYAEVFGEHHISAMAGYTMSYWYDSWFKTTAYKYSKEDDHYTLLGNGSFKEGQRPEESISEQAMLSVMGRVGYSYGDRYFVTGSIRRDATSKLHLDNNWGIFPAFSGTWKISSEEFFPKTDYVNLVKLRGGWGQIGNVSTVPNYSYSAALRNPTDYLGVIGKDPKVANAIYVETIPNLDLTWETTQQTSLGLDVTAFNNTLELSIDYFNKLTKDLIDEDPIPPAAGIEVSPKGNLGRVSNKGWEFSAAYNNRIGDVSFNVNTILSTVKSEVLEFYGGKLYPHSNFGNSGPQPLRSMVGQPWWSYMLIKTDGIFQTQAEIDAYTWTNPETGAVEKIQRTARPGDLKFIDFNNDGIIGDGDRQFMGSYLPELTYSFGGSVEWKGIDCSVFFQGITGVKIFNGFRSIAMRGRSVGHYFLEDALDNWMYDHSSKNPNIALFEDLNGNFTNASDFFLEDGSYLRLKNLTIGYTIPKGLLARIGMGGLGLRFYASGENLLTFTKYSGFDPEVGNHGIDGGQYPVARAFNFGLNLNF